MVGYFTPGERPKEPTAPQETVIVVTFRIDIRCIVAVRSAQIDGCIIPIPTAKPSPRYSFKFPVFNFPKPQRPAVMLVKKITNHHRFA